MKRKKSTTKRLGIVVLILIAQVYANSSFSQAMFQKTFGTQSDEIGTFVILDNKGNYAITGHHFNQNNNSRDILLLQLDSCGNQNFSELYGGKKDDIGMCIQQLSTSDYIIAGTTYSYGIGQDDQYLIKTSNTGTPISGVSVGGVNNENSEYLAVDNKNEVVKIGSTNYDTLNRKSDIYVTCTNSAGGLMWTRTYGGKKDDYGFSIKYTPVDSGYILAGSTRSYGAGGLDAYIIKINKVGGVIWAKSYGSKYDDEAFDITLCKSGGYAFTGRTRDTISKDSSGITLSNNVYVVRINNNGGVIWTNYYGGSKDEQGEAIIECADSSTLVIAGNTYSFGAGNSDGYLLKLQSNGNMIWGKAYGGSKEEAFYSVVHTRDNGYFTVGKTNSFGSGLNDIYTVKTDINGKSGCYEKDGGLQHKASGVSDTLYSITQFGQPDKGFKADSVFFYDTILCSTCKIDSTADSAKYFRGSNIHSSTGTNSDISLFPNPAKQNIFVKSSFDLKENYELVIINNLGATVFREQLSGSEINSGKLIDINKLPNGIYQLIIQGNSIKTKKFIVTH